MRKKKNQRKHGVHCSTYFPPTIFIAQANDKFCQATPSIKVEDD